MWKQTKEQLDFAIYFHPEMGSVRQVPNFD